MPKKKRSLTSPLRNNPNATAGGSGGIVGLALVYVAGLAGLEISAEGAGLIVGACGVIVLAIGKSAPS